MRTDSPPELDSGDLPQMREADEIQAQTPLPSFVGDYQIVRRIEGGGMADVFLAHKMARFGFVRRALIKRVKRSRPGYQNLQRALLDEARATSLFDHPNIVQLLDIGEDDQGVYLAIEFVEGTDLRWVNSKLRTRKEALPFELACYVTGEILRGLHHAHHVKDFDGRPLEIVHRDVNPSNVLISFTGHVKLADFGVVRMRDRLQQKTEVGLVKGKYAYLAPEYIAGESCNLQTDIYAAGVMLFELLCGRECFTGATAYEVMWKIVNRGVPLYRLEREGVPDDLGRIVQRAVNPVPERRYESAQEMANALETWLMRSGKHATPWVLSVFFHRHGLYPPREEAMPRPIPESRRLAAPQDDSGPTDVPVAQGTLEPSIDLAMEAPVEHAPPEPVIEAPVTAAARAIPAPPPLDDGGGGQALEQDARLVRTTGTTDLLLDPPPLGQPAAIAEAPKVEKTATPPRMPAPKIPPPDATTVPNIDIHVLEPSGSHVAAEIPSVESTPAGGVSAISGESMPVAIDDPWDDKIPPDADGSEEPTSPGSDLPLPDEILKSPVVETIDPTDSQSFARANTDKMAVLSARPEPPPREPPPLESPDKPKDPDTVLLREAPPIMLDDLRFEDPIEASIPGARTPQDDSLTPMPPIEQLEAQPIGPVGTVPWSGKLEEISGAEALDRLSKAGASGRLEFKCGLIWKRVQLDQGTPTGITSNMGMELIGEHLVKARLLSRRELDRALHGAEREGRPLTAKLLELGLVDRATLEVELGKNLAARMVEVLEWRWGTFEFIPEEVESATLRPRLDLEALIHDAIAARASEVEPEEAPASNEDSAQSKLKEAFKRARSIAQSTGKGRVDTLSGEGRQPSKPPR